MTRNNNTINNEAPKPHFDKESFSKALQIFKYVKPYRWYFIGGMIALFMSSVVFMAFPYIFGLLVDIAEDKSALGLSLSSAGVVLVGLLIIQAVFSYLRVIFFAHVSEKGIADVRKDVYARMICLPVTFFEQNRVGELISRITADVEKLYSVFSIVLAEFLRQIIVLIVGTAFIALTTPKLSLIMLATFPIMVLGAMIFGRYIRRLSKERQQALADTNIIVSETMQSINTVKAFTNEGFEFNRYEGGIKNVVKIALRFAFSRAIFSVFMVMVLFGALFFVFWQGTAMIQSGAITSGQLVSFFTYTILMGAAMASLGNFWSQILGAVGATERIREILDSKTESELAFRGNKKPGRFHGDVSFKNVQFSYPTRPDMEVLKGINLDIKAGQRVALVGTSGAGKSTIMQLLLQYYEIAGGEIRVDGQSIYDFELDAYRRNLGIVPQEVILFGGTIRENILYGKPDATGEEVLIAARQSNSMEFIQSFPDGLETIVGERGVKLSGGQRQRIAIARALLKNPAILLLDEATSALDAESEKVVQEALDKLMEGRTSIIIAHRLATIKDVDCIFVIDNGRVIEQGTHNELSLIDEGIYSGLARLQFETI